MAESKTLLSQREIDALISFLQYNQGGPIGTVLEQSSVDKLIDLMTFNCNQGVLFDNNDLSGINSPDTVLLDKDSNIDAQKEHCVLECAVTSKGYMEIYCNDQLSYKKYVITPSFLEQKKIVPGDSSEWGFAIAPKYFRQISDILGISYSAETFMLVCRSFAKMIYGYEDAVIADIYMGPRE